MEISIIKIIKNKNNNNNSMVDNMSAIEIICSEIDSIHAALNTLKSNVLNLIKFEKPSVPKKRAKAEDYDHIISFTFLAYHIFFDYFLSFNYFTFLAHYIYFNYRISFNHFNLLNHYISFDCLNLLDHYISFN